MRTAELIVQAPVVAAQRLSRWVLEVERSDELETELLAQRVRRGVLAG